MEALASFTYLRILSNPHLHEHFENDVKLSAFWKTLDDAQRIRLWGAPLNLSTIQIARAYDQWGRASPQSEGL
jgi:hypothetical protein